MIIERLPTLPEDIQRLLLETIVELEPSMDVELVLLSKQTQEWIDPLLFKSVVLWTDKSIYSFAKLIKSSAKPPSFFANRVKSLLIRETGWMHTHWDDVIFIISSCSGLYRLILWLRTLEVSSLANLDQNIASSSLKRFSCSCDALTILRYFPPDYGIFQGITHLSLYMEDEATISAWQPLSCLFELTHLYLELYESHAIVSIHDALLAYLPSSLVIMALHPNCISFPRLTYDWVVNQCDHRVVLSQTIIDDPLGLPMPQPIFSAFVLLRYWQEEIHDWCLMNSKAPDLWDLAEEILTRRRGMRTHLRARSCMQLASVFNSYV